MRVAIHQPNFAPFLGFFHKLKHADLFVFLDDAQFARNRFINRNRIKTSQGVQWLTIPVIQKGRGRQAIKDVLIADGNWREKILGSLQRGYARAVYFDPLFQFLSEILKRKWTRLSEMNIALLSWLSMEMDIRTPTMKATDLNVGGESTERLVRICQAVGADEYLSGPTGKGYMDESLFKKAGIMVSYSDFIHPVYPQLWGEFEPNLSVFDYLFLMGGGNYETLSSLQPSGQQAPPEGVHVNLQG